ncbi:MAG: O-antigen ligase family protein [Nonlabens sp.]|nr:O-antigen ligase family protein [Nonlabens sp.]
MKAFKQNSSWIDKSLPQLIATVFFCFGLFPILPNKLKGLPVILLALLAVITLFSKTRRSVKGKEFIAPVLFTALFVCYAMSMLYTEDIKTGMRRMETSLSFVLVPWSLFALSLLTVNFRTIFVKFQKVFVLSATIYGLVIVWFFWDIGYYNGLHDLEYSLSWLDGMLWGLSQHPIYAAMFTSVALIFVPHLWPNLQKQERIIACISIVINVYILFLLIRKGVIIALVIALLIWVYQYRKQLGLLKISLGVIIILLIGLLFKPSLEKRFSEFVSPQSYTNLDIEKSTSMRYVIYKCTWNEIKKSPIVGHGVGDGYDLIASCLKSNFNVVFEDSKQFKNSHNQYLGILLYVGLTGFSFFIMQLGIYFKRAFERKDLLYVQLLLFFVILLTTENLLDRQSGIILFMFFMNGMFFLQVNINREIKSQN